MGRAWDMRCAYRVWWGLRERDHVEDLDMD